MIKGFQKPKSVEISGFRVRHKEGADYFTLEFTDDHNRVAFSGKVPPTALMVLSNKIQHFFEALAAEGVDVGAIRADSGVDPTKFDIMNAHITDALHLVCQEQGVDLQSLFCRMLQKDHVQPLEQYGKGVQQVFDALVAAIQEQEGR